MIILHIYKLSLLLLLSVRKTCFSFAISYVRLFVVFNQLDSDCMRRKKRSQIIFHESVEQRTTYRHSQLHSDLVKIVLWQLIKLEQRKVKFFSHIAMARTYTHPTHLILSLGHANHSSFRPHAGFASSSMQRVYDLVASSRTYMYGRLEKSCFASCFESLQVNGSIIRFRFTSSFSLRHPLTCFSVRQNSRVGECM